MNKLKRCPFCGGTGYYQTDDVEVEYRHFIECVNCCGCTGQCASKEIAADAWNKRTERKKPKRRKKP